MLLVLDKCFVTAEKAEVIRELRSQFRFVMPTSFFMEMLTSSNPVHLARIAAKFAGEANPAAEVDLSRLVRFELDQHEAAWPVQQFWKEDFYFNPDLSRPDFSFLPEDVETMANWEIRNHEQVPMWKAQASAVIRWFPELVEYRPGQPAHQIATAMQRVGEDHEFVREIYESFRNPKFPPGKRLDTQWTLFRSTQVHLLAALRYVQKYGATDIPGAPHALHNDLLDIDYAILATLVGAFASHDKGPREIFKLACPDGRLIPSIGEGLPNSTSAPR